MIIKIILIAIFVVVILLCVLAVSLFVMDNHPFDSKKLDEILDEKYPLYPDETFYLGDKPKYTKKNYFIKRSTKK